MKSVPTPPKTKIGPGEYKPDIAFERIEDLPRPKLIKQSRNYTHRACPRCGKPPTRTESGRGPGKSAFRDRIFVRPLHDVGDLLSGRPHELRITYSQHYCSACRKYFNVDLTDLAPPHGHYTHRVMALAVRLVVEDGLPYRSASWTLWRDHRVFVPFATIQNWVEAGGKKGD